MLMKKKGRKLIHCLFTLALFLVVLSGVCVTAKAADLTGAGTEAEPYKITNASDWNTFADWIKNGKNADKYYQLTTDIDGIFTMVGSDANHAFQGVFDGNGKTLTVNINGSEQGVAPFHYINSATIKKVTVKGNINSSDIHVGGLVGFAKHDSTNTIDSCVVCAEITSSAADSMAGGIIGHAGKSKTTIQKCAFLGKIKAIYIGGICGWADGVSDTQLTIIKCFENGSYTDTTFFNPIFIVFSL